ncbi:MAG: hypothetical protein RIQ54_507 [Candidatus Parcubacteria bacterium]
MLQQTQVARVVEKYQQFIKKFPTIRALANSSPAAVLRAWQGLGYNRRALFLYKTANIIAQQHKGIVPLQPEVLQKLPGIGAYTAVAIAVFAGQQSGVCIETNIRRVFIHHFFADKKNIADSEILPIIEKTVVGEKNPRRWYWALMDYGASLPKMIQSNPNRKSSQYAKQSKFIGSLRHARGIVLKVLIKNKNTSSLSHLQKELKKRNISPQNSAKAIHALHKEGFINIRNNMIGLR